MKKKPIRGCALVLLMALLGTLSEAVPMVSICGQHGLALRSDDTVLSWGSDSAGQLGSGRLAFATRPGLYAETAENSVTWVLRSNQRNLSNWRSL
jgi:alpha-tubulin suppressor-like RCC1 family protein